MTLFPRNSDVRRELGCGQVDFRAYLDDEGQFISKFKLLPNGTRHCIDSNLKEYQELIYRLSES